MHIQKIQIKNFKAFQDVTINLNSDVNIFTGKNNSGKTTILEAVALWHECFNKLINQEGQTTINTFWEEERDSKTATINSRKYFLLNEINSIRSANFVDIFHQQERNNQTNGTKLERETRR